MRILFIRGGGLGDLIVTLPTLRLLREKWPEAHIELLGHPRLAEIAMGRFYLDGVRSVDHGPLSAFFTPRAVLDPEWMDYIGSFDLVLSYFYDPDGLFLANLKRCQPAQILTYPPRVPPDFGQPAARHFARILEPLGLTLGDDAASDCFGRRDDADAAQGFLGGLPSGVRLVAVHPSSGSATKNWPVERWAELGERLIRDDPALALLLVEGEADGEPAHELAARWKDLPLLRARLLPLPILASVLRQAAVDVGHDSGVTHLAGACRRDLPVVALFGPSDPAIWAPPREGVTVWRGDPALADLPVDRVFGAVAAALKLSPRS